MPLLLSSICCNKISHLSRMDFLYGQNGNIVLEEHIFWLYFNHTAEFLMKCITWGNKSIYSQNGNQISVCQHRIMGETSIEMPGNITNKCSANFPIIILIMHWLTNYPILMSSSPSSSTVLLCPFCCTKTKNAEKGQNLFSPNLRQHSN